MFEIIRFLVSESDSSSKINENSLRFNFCQFSISANFSSRLTEWVKPDESSSRPEETEIENYRDRNLKELIIRYFPYSESKKIDNSSISTCLIMYNVLKSLINYFKNSSESKNSNQKPFDKTTILYNIIKDYKFFFHTLAEFDNEKIISGEFAAKHESDIILIETF